MSWHYKTFDQFSAVEVYELLRLRSAVFVVEQDCVYQDLDNQDQAAFHIYKTDGRRIVACARVLAPGTAYEEVSIGRVIVDSEYRGADLGVELMLRCEEWIWDAYPKSKEIKIMAQCYLEQWYGRQGYVGQGEEFLEDGIPHRIMVKPTL